MFFPAFRLLLGANTSVDNSEVTSSPSTSLRTSARAIHAALNICLFPPLFFFSALYYTDIASTGFVLVFLDLRQNKALSSRPWLRGFLLVLTGFVALIFRQTNIFWVAVFPAGLDAFELLKTQARDHGKREIASGVSFVKSITKAWQDGTVYDPPVHDAYLEGEQ